MMAKFAKLVLPVFLASDSVDCLLLRGSETPSLPVDATRFFSEYGPGSRAEDLNVMFKDVKDTLEAVLGASHKKDKQTDMKKKMSMLDNKVTGEFTLKKEGNLIREIENIKSVFDEHKNKRSFMSHVKPGQYKEGFEKSRDFHNELCSARDERKKKNGVNGNGDNNGASSTSHSNAVEAPIEGNGAEADGDADDAHKASLRWDHAEQVARNHKADKDAIIEKSQGKIQKDRISAAKNVCALNESAFEDERIAKEEHEAERHEIEARREQEHRIKWEKARVNYQKKSQALQHEAELLDDEAKRDLEDAKAYDEAAERCRKQEEQDETAAHDVDRIKLESMAAYKEAENDKMRSERTQERVAMVARQMAHLIRMKEATSAAEEADKKSAESWAAQYEEYAQRRKERRGLETTLNQDTHQKELDMMAKFSENMLAKNTVAAAKLRHAREEASRDEKKKERDQRSQFVGRLRLNQRI